MLQGPSLEPDDAPMFFIPGYVYALEEVFFLSYGGLSFSENELMHMPTPRRRWYVERLRAQLAHERKVIRNT